MNSDEKQPVEPVKAVDPMKDPKITSFAGAATGVFSWLILPVVMAPMAIIFSTLGIINAIKMKKPVFIAVSVVGMLLGGSSCIFLFMGPRHL